MTFTKPSRIVLPWGRGDLLACLGCAAVGLILAIEPHLGMWSTRGTIDYVADGDDALYLAISRVPLYDGWVVRDPFSPPREGVPTLYAWLQFVPLAKLARALGLSAVRTALLWRCVGGPLLGAALFAVFRQVLGGTRRPTAWALGCALICLADGGLIGGRVLVHDLSLLSDLGSRQSELGQRGLPQYRVVTPLLNLPFLLLLAAVLAPGGRRGWGALVAGAICLGLCFQLYFFFWTAACLTLGAYYGAMALIWLARRGRDPAGWNELGFGAAVLAGGLALGAPQVIGNARTFSDPQYRPILDRMMRGRALAPDDPARTAYLRKVWPLAEAALGGAAIVGLGLGSLALPWCLVVSGYLLCNSALVLGLEFENYHWNYVMSTFGEILLLATAALVLDGLGPARWKRWLWVVPAVLVGIAAAWRPHAATDREAVEMAERLGDLEPLRPSLAALGPDEVLAGPAAANLAVLYTRAGLLYQHDQTWQSSPIPTAEVGRRFALNAWLLGMDSPPPLDRDEEQARTYFRGAREARAEGFRAVLGGEAGELLRRYRVGALLLPADASAPVRGGPWRLEARGPRLELWRRDVDGSP